MADTRDETVEQGGGPCFAASDRLLVDTPWVWWAYRPLPAHWCPTWPTACECEDAT